MFQLPDNPSTSSATVGKDYLLKVNKGTVANPELVIVGGQRGTSVGMSADEIDVATKSSGGWAEKLAGLKSWNFDLDGLLLLNEEGIGILRQAFYQSKQINAFLFLPDGSFQGGWSSITDFSYETPHDGEATLKGTLNGVGPLSDISQIMNKGESKDLTFYFEKTATATAIKLAETTLDANNYTANVPGQVTIKGLYLATLSVGSQLFYVDLSIGGHALCGVTIKDPIVNIAPTTATVSIAAATDKVFTIVPSSETVSGVKNGSTALNSETDYSYSAGSLTIKSAYLATLSVGTTALTVTTGSGALLTINLTVTE